MWEHAIAIKTKKNVGHDFNLSINLNQWGLGFFLVFGDFITQFELNILCFSFFYFKSNYRKV